MLDIRDKNAYFPQKLQDIIENKPSLKYFLKEKDIKIDMLFFNDVMLSIFNDFFLGKKMKPFNTNAYKNVLFISHSRLDCYALFKMVKCLYGKPNCINIWKDSLAGKHKEVLVAVNDLIEMYVHNKHILNSSSEFKMYASEVKNFIDEQLAKMA